MQTIQEKYNKISIPELKKKFGYKNNLAIPRILKVVVNIGTGSLKDKKKEEIIVKDLSLITGQKTSARVAKQSIASFKLREGQVVGHAVTLRGKRMYEFLDKLVNIALPRTRDFRGLNEKGVDSMGNFSMAIREHTVFPESSSEDLNSIFSFGITVVTNTNSKEESLELLKSLGFPFSKK